LRGADGQWYTTNVAGTFRYLSDRKNKMAVFLQFKQVGSGSEISAITIRAQKTLIQAVDSRVLVDGKVVSTFPAKAGKGQLVKKGVWIVLKGFGGERAAFTQQMDGSYSINVGIRAGRTSPISGLMYDIKSPRKYQISEGQSKKLFQSFFAFKQIVGFPKFSRSKAEKCCAAVKKFDAKRFEDCVGDAVNSGKCYAATYLNSNEKGKEAMTKA